MSAPAGAALCSAVLQMKKCGYDDDDDDPVSDVVSNVMLGMTEGDEGDEDVGSQDLIIAAQNTEDGKTSIIRDK